MATLHNLLAEAQKLNYDIKRVLKLSTYHDYDDISGLQIDTNDSEELFLWDELCSIMQSLDDAYDRLSYLASPVVEVSKLHRNASGRFETDSGYYYCSGNRIEALLRDDRHDAPYWVRTSVEHDGQDYYLVKCNKKRLNGLTVRIRDYR